MDLKLNGRTAIITGSSQGIGKSVAIALAREGCNIILCARGIKKLKSVAEEIKKINTDIRIFYDSVDATNQASVQSFFHRLAESGFSAIDILVNNVGGGTGKPHGLFGLTEKDWVEMYKLNVLSVVWFTENALHFLEKSDQARIINIGSATSHQPGLYNPHYGAAKSALDFLTKRMANELAPKGICVNIIGPHALICENWERDVRDYAANHHVSIDEARTAITKDAVAKIPMGRQGNNEDIANLAVYLASAQANFIAGAYIPVDGSSLKARP